VCNSRALNVYYVYAAFTVHTADRTDLSRATSTSTRSQVGVRCDPESAEGVVRNRRSTPLGLCRAKR
jgi:hypothetical protein